MKLTPTTKNVSIPQATLQKMIGAMTAIEEAKEHIEDFLMLSNKKIVAELNRAKLDQVKGRVQSWQVLKTRYGVSSHSHRNV